MVVEPLECQRCDYECFCTNYEAKYATPGRLAKPPAKIKCGFCGAHPGELHAFDCIKLDEPDDGEEQESGYLS